MNINRQTDRLKAVEWRERGTATRTTHLSPRETRQVGVVSRRGLWEHCVMAIDAEYEEDEGSEEESGKDWDELEAEARRGTYTHPLSPSVYEGGGLTHRPLLSPPLSWKPLILCFRTRGIFRKSKISHVSH